MSLKRRITDAEKDGYEAEVCTLHCDDTGEKMLEIIVRDSEEENAPINVVEALWAYGESYGKGSGKHEISGLLSYSPIISPSITTEVVDIKLSEQEDSDSAIVRAYLIKDEG